MSLMDLWQRVRPLLNPALMVAGSCLWVVIVTPNGVYAKSHFPDLPVVFQGNFDPPEDDAPDDTVGASSRVGAAALGEATVSKRDILEKHRSWKDR